MKPTVKHNLNKRALRNDATRFPQIERNYHAVALPSYRGGCLQPQFPSFRNISGEYFRTEARNEFRAEAAAFVAIIVTAVIPILNNMHALADFLRGVGTL